MRLPAPLNLRPQASLGRSNVFEQSELRVYSSSYFKRALEAVKRYMEL